MLALNQRLADALGFGDPFLLLSEEAADGLTLVGVAASCDLSGKLGDPWAVSKSRIPSQIQIRNVAFTSERYDFSLAQLIGIVGIKWNTNAAFDLGSRYRRQSMCGARAMS